MKTELTSEQRIEALKALGFALVSGEPFPQERDEFYSITFNVKVTFKEKSIYGKTYSLGIGYVDPKKCRSSEMARNPFSEDELGMLYSWQNNPHASFKNKALQCQVAAKLAIEQKLKPKLDEVLHSLMLDAECFFNAQSFEEWAGDYGYDPDSRKAEAIYRECDSIGRRIAAVVPKDVLEQVREIVSDL